VGVGLGKLSPKQKANPEGYLPSLKEEIDKAGKP